MAAWRSPIVEQPSISYRELAGRQHGHSVYTAAIVSQLFDSLMEDTKNNPDLLFDLMKLRSVITRHYVLPPSRYFMSLWFYLDYDAQEMLLRMDKPDTYIWDLVRQRNRSWISRILYCTCFQVREYIVDWCCNSIVSSNMNLHCAH